MRADFQSLLPLTPTVFHMLLALWLPTLLDLFESALENGRGKERSPCRKRD
jgi:hypothetical protein